MHVKNGRVSFLARIPTAATMREVGLGERILTVVQFTVDFKLVT